MKIASNTIFAVVAFVAMVAIVPACSQTQNSQAVPVKYPVIYENEPVKGTERYQPIMLDERAVFGDSISLVKALSGYNAPGGVSQEISILLKPWNYAKGFSFLLLGPISEEDMIHFELSVRQLINGKKGVVDEVDFLKLLPNKEYEKMKLLVVKK